MEGGFHNLKSFGNRDPGARCMGHRLTHFQLGSILLMLATSGSTAFSTMSQCAIGKAKFAAKLAVQASHVPSSVHHTFPLRLRGAGCGGPRSSATGAAAEVVEEQASPVRDAAAMQWRFKHDNQWLEYGANASQRLEEALSAGTLTNRVQKLGRHN